jgi:hypothetical protein
MCSLNFFLHGATPLSQTPQSRGISAAIAWPSFSPIFFLWCWGSNAGPYACWVRALPLNYTTPALVYLRWGLPMSSGWPRAPASTFLVLGPQAGNTTILLPFSWWSWGSKLSSRGSGLLPILNKLTYSVWLSSITIPGQVVQLKRKLALWWSVSVNRKKDIQEIVQIKWRPRLQKHSPLFSHLYAWKICASEYMFVFGGTGVCNQDFALAKQGSLPLEPHLQSILLCLFWRWGLMNYLPGLTLNPDPLNLSIPRR